MICVQVFRILGSIDDSEDFNTGIVVHVTSYMHACVHTAMYFIA